MSGTSNTGQVSFSTIPQNARVPLFHVEFDNSQAGASQPNQRSLIVATAAPGVSMAPGLSLVPSPAWVASVFGADSVLADMTATYRQNDPVGELWLANLQPVAGSPATATMVITGTATATGALSVYHDGRDILVPVLAGQTGAVVATSLAAASPSGAVFDVLGSRVANTGTVTFGADVTGVLGNFHDLRLNYYGSAAGEAVPPGLSVAVTPFTGGTSAPDLTGLPALLGAQNFDFIASPYTDPQSNLALGALMNDSAGRWSDSAQTYGGVFTATDDSFSNLVALGSGQNDQHRTIFGTVNCPSPPWEIAAAAAGTMATALRADPARPLQTLSVQGLLAPSRSDRLTPAQRQTLLANGVATMCWNDDGTCQIERAVTTYQFNKFGQADNSYLDTETMFTLMAVTRRLKAAITSKFARCKLADDGTAFGPGQPIVTPKSIRAELVAEYRGMVRDGLVDNIDLFAAGLVVVRNSIDPSRVDVLFDPYLISGLRIFAVLNQFRLQAA